MSVLDFYSRGGDFGCDKARSILLAPQPVTARCSDQPGAGTATPLLARDGTEIRPLGIPGLSQPTPGLTGSTNGTNGEKENLLAFLLSLTDERVKYRKAPFDHPQLFVPNGQLNDDLTAVKDPKEKGQAKDRITEIQAVGATGGDPLPTFLNLQ
jgi:hypothetical protein